MKIKIDDVTEKRGKKPIVSTISRGPTILSNVYVRGYFGTTAIFRIRVRVYS